MSQLIVCQNENGIILAADSKALDFEPGGKMVELEVDRLYQLTPYTAILTGGAAEGAKMCRALKDFIAKEDLEGIEEVYSAAHPFLASEYEHFMRKACEYLPLDPIHHFYYILAGYNPKDNSNPFRMYLLWTKKKLPQIDGEEISSAFTVPRIMRLEYKLTQLCKNNGSLEDILPEIQKNLENQSEIQQEVAGPFTYAFITREGFRKIQ